MLTTTDISPVLEATGEKLLQSLIDAQSRRGLRASGYSAENSRAEVVVAGQDVTLKLIGPGYWRLQNDGRRPNRNGRPNRAQLDGLREWIKTKGIEPEALWPIAVHQAKYGTPVPNPHNPGGVLSEALESPAITTQLKADLRVAAIRSLKAKLFA